MATRSTVCPTCGGAVPRGRLSCPACGVLLASIAGPSRGSKSTKSPVPAVEAAAPDPVPATAAAGAYIPPSATPPAQLLQARAWAGLTSVAPRPMAVATAGAMPAGGFSGGGPVATVAPVRADAAPASRDVVAAPAVEPSWLEATAGWLTIIGSAVAILGFLLPWSRTVIGAENVGSYFDTWGMANASHVLVVLALLAALGLAIVANPVPTWIRTCAAGLILGGLLVGLTWPYLMGPLGAGPGVMAILIGGVMLAVAGVVDLVEARHAASGPIV
jgi:hypothetical protein